MNTLCIRTASVLASLLALGLGACGGAGGGNAFAHVYADNEPSQIDEVVRRLSAASAPADDPVAVGLTESHLFAFDLSAGRQLWTEAIQEPRGEAYIAGPLVLLHEGDRVEIVIFAGGGSARTMSNE